jgi:hypothetical protein
MTDRKRRDTQPAAEDPSFQIRLPGFVTDEAVGLGDAVKRVSYALGMAPCGGCERRAAVLNRWVGFTGPRR